MKIPIYYLSFALVALVGALVHASPIPGDLKYGILSDVHRRDVDQVLSDDLVRKGPPLKFWELFSREVALSATPPLKHLYASPTQRPKGSRPQLPPKDRKPPQLPPKDHKPPQLPPKDHEPPHEPPPSPPRGSDKDLPVVPFDDVLGEKDETLRYHFRPVLNPKGKKEITRMEGPAPSDLKRRPAA